MRQGVTVFNNLLSIPLNSYHFEGSLPQYDVLCKERLVRPEDPANASAQLSLQVAAQVNIARNSFFRYYYVYFDFCTCVLKLKRTMAMKTKCLSLLDGKLFQYEVSTCPCCRTLQCWQHSVQFMARANKHTKAARVLRRLR